VAESLRSPAEDDSIWRPLSPRIEEWKRMFQLRELAKLAAGERRSIEASSEPAPTSIAMKGARFVPEAEAAIRYHRDQGWKYTIEQLARAWPNGSGADGAKGRGVASSTVRRNRLTYAAVLNALAKDVAWRDLLERKGYLSNGVPTARD
jgi:hypothetical protein